MLDFDSDLGNSDKVIEVTDVTPEAFRAMLKFIYTRKLDGLNQQNLFDILHAGNFCIEFSFILKVKKKLSYGSNQ